MRALLLVLAALLVIYLAIILTLIIAGKRTQARAIAGFIPDCIVLFKRLLSDPNTPSKNKFGLYLLIAYLALPVDLIPDFIPVAGQLDEAILVILVLRRLIKSVGTEVITRHWPGPKNSLAVILKFASAT